MSPQAQTIAAIPLHISKAYAELFSTLNLALSYYSNVHRGSGYNSQITTSLYERSKELVLEYLQLSRKQYDVIFSPPAVSKELTKKISKSNYKSLSSAEFGLPIGLSALAVKKSAFPKGVHFMAGGGTARLTSPEWIIWEKGPGKFEAGTPAIVNSIAFAKALQLVKTYGGGIFQYQPECKLSIEELLYRDNLMDLSGAALITALREQHIGRNTKVPTIFGEKIFINFDCAASTPTFTPVRDVYFRVLEHCANGDAIISETRKICSQFLNAPSDEYDISFASNTTEAINLAARYLVPDDNSVIAISLLEHTSNDLPWRINRKEVIRLDIDSDGLIDLAVLEKLLTDYNKDGIFGEKRIKLVSVTGASNVLGIYNDLKKISEIVHRYDALLVTDAAQMAAHHKIDMKESGIDVLAFSAHKVYAPFGTGILAMKKGLLKLPSNEYDEFCKSGEENIAGIAALAKSLIILSRIGFEAIYEKEKALTSKALQEMSGTNGIVLYGVQSANSPVFAKKGAVIAFHLKGVMPHELGKKLESCGIGLRFGCHCAHILVKHILRIPPPLKRFQHLLAVLFPSLKFPGVDRISFGLFNTAEEIDNFISILKKISLEPRGVSSKAFKPHMVKYIDGIVEEAFTPKAG